MLLSPVKQAKQKQRRAEVAQQRSITNTKPKHKSPSKLRRLARRAEDRANGVVKPVRTGNPLAARPEHRTKRQKTSDTLKVLAEVVKSNRKPLEDMTKPELMIMAKDANIPGRSKMDKAALIKALS